MGKLVEKVHIDSFINGCRAPGMIHMEGAQIQSLAKQLDVEDFKLLLTAVRCLKASQTILGVDSKESEVMEARLRSIISQGD